MATTYNQSTGQTVNGQPVYTSGDTATSPVSQVPAAQTPLTPSPQLTTPPVAQATQPTTTVNVNAAPQAPATTSTTPQAESSYTVKSGDTLGGIAKQGGMSVIDLINQNPQYAQNPNLIRPGEIVNMGKKYQEAYNANKGTAVPENGAAARGALDSYFNENQPQQQEDPQKNFFDTYLAMNPVVKTMYDTINQELSHPVTTTTFKDEYTKLLGEQGIPALQTDLMNIKNIMDGTEDDIRTEISKAGGGATESQVQALTGARNKTLLKQANSLQQQLALKEDYVNQLMQFSQLDRKKVEDEVDRKLGLTEKMANIQDKISSAAKENYQKIVDYGKEVGENGYAYLANALGNDKAQMRLAEQSLGLPSGALENSGFTSVLPASKASLPGSVQEYEYAKSEGFKGSFIDYQNQDANRKKSIAAAGAGGGMGLTPAQINSSVNTIAGAFDNEQIVKSYNTVQEGFQTISNIGVDTKSPADDIAFIYAFAKIMDPNSVVREGEYNTIQKYAQTWADNFGFKAQRIFSNTNFLTADAKQKMLNALTPKVQTITNQYKNLQSEYQRQVNDAYQGKPRQITNYSVPVTELPGLPKDGDTKMYNGVEYIYNGSGWVKKGTQASTINWSALTIK